MLKTDPIKYNTVTFKTKSMRNDFRVNIIISV